MRKSTGSQVAIARISAEGDLYLKGRVHQYPWATSGPGAFPDPQDMSACFTLKTAEGAPFALFSEAGHLYLRGALVQGRRPDPGHGRETLVWFEDFEGPQTLAERGWTVYGPWTHTRYAQYTATMTSAGWRDQTQAGCQQCPNLTSPEPVAHGFAAFGQITIDTDAAQGNSVGAGELIIGTKSNQALTANTARWTSVDMTAQDPCNLCLVLNAAHGTDNKEYYLESPIGQGQYTGQLDGTKRWRFDAVSTGGHQVGGWANGWRATQADGSYKHSPNHFATLNSTPTGGEYIERELPNMAGNDGFLVDIYYQITRDGGNATPSNNPGLALELYEEGATTPVIRLAAHHYFEIDGEGKLFNLTSLFPEVDWNRDGQFGGAGEVPDPQQFYPTYDRSDILSHYSPRLRLEVVWYKLGIWVQRDPVDHRFRAGFLTRVEGVQRVPVYWETSAEDLADGEAPVEPVRIRLTSLNSYASNGNIRIDDITVTKLSEY